MDLEPLVQHKVQLCGREGKPRTSTSPSLFQFYKGRIGVIMSTLLRERTISSPLPLCLRMADFDPHYYIFVSLSFVSFIPHPHNPFAKFLFLMSQGLKMLGILAE